jgi:hypothetical protein
VGAGKGFFTIDIPATWTDYYANPPVLVYATDVAGGPGPSVGSWVDIHFGANNMSGGLAISDGVHELIYSGRIHSERSVPTRA